MTSLSTPYLIHPKLKYLLHSRCFLLLAGALIGTTGCDKSADPDIAMAKDSQAAASQLEAAFDQAGETARLAARAAAEAIRQKNYEKAVASLEAARTVDNVTLAQGIAVHSSLVALEGELLIAAQGGDLRAKQAYQLLKAMKAK